MQYKYVTVTQFAKANNVSRQLVLEWILNRRIDVYRPAAGVTLIANDTKRPKAMQPWEIKRLSYET